MSILIKGMEMQKDGFITITVTSDGRVVGNSKKENGKFEYLDNEDIAKAVPVPPHGRLGDLDELYAHLNEWYLTHSPCFTKEEAIYIRAMLLGIAEAPTIIPAEEEDRNVE